MSNGLCTQRFRILQQSSHHQNPGPIQIRHAELGVRQLVAGACDCFQRGRKLAAKVIQIADIVASHSGSSQISLGPRSNLRPLGVPQREGEPPTFHVQVASIEQGSYERP